MNKIDNNIQHNNEHSRQNNAKHRQLFFVLSGIFLTNALIAEVIGVKIFSLEQTFGFKPANLSIGSFILDFNLTAGVLIWPVVFICSDLINEYFGPKGVRQISFWAAGLIVYSFFAIWLTTTLPPAGFWLDIYKNQSIDINKAFSLLFKQGLGIILGSLTAFLVGQILDAYIFHRFKQMTGGAHIWLRATGSTIISQLLDSFLVLFIAFYVFGSWPIEQVFAVGFINYIYKFSVAVLLTPVLYLAHGYIDRYLAKSKNSDGHI